MVRKDGSWSYFYFQENLKPEARDFEYTNRGLIECWRDNVPVAVMRQVSKKPRPMYRILGLALVAGWTEGYFILEGFSRDGRSHGRGSPIEAENVMVTHEVEGLESPEVESLPDGRERILALIARRRGQPEFRRKLLEAYGGRCAITGCDAADALEAAHILPYRGPGSNHPSNGLLLRVDIHTLFDLGLISIDTATMSVLLATSLAKSVYKELLGKQLRLPNNKSRMASKSALDQHRGWSRL